VGGCLSGGGIKAVTSRGGYATRFQFKISNESLGEIPAPTELAVGDCARISVRVLQVLGPDEMLLRDDSPDSRLMLRLKGVRTDGIVDGKYWEGIVVAVGTYRYASVTGAVRTIIDCRPFQKDVEPVTRQQLAEALNKGLKLTIWKPTRRKTSSTSISLPDGKQRTVWAVQFKATLVE